LAKAIEIAKTAIKHFGQIVGQPELGVDLLDIVRTRL
jgi:hypothetical protein